MDRSTVDHYNRNADAHAARYEQTEVGALRAVMRRCLTPGSRVLDIGCGSGRDAAFLLEQGHDVTAADAAPEMIAAACAFHPELADRTIEAGFPLPPDHPLLKERFDAVCAVAMIMHVPAELLFEFALQLKQMLRPGGTLIVSASENRPGLSDDRDPPTAASLPNARRGRCSSSSSVWASVKSSSKPTRTPWAVTLAGTPSPSGAPTTPAPAPSTRSRR